MMTMEFCPNCGNSVISCGTAEWNPKVNLYGCFSCDNLYEEQQKHSLDGDIECWWKKSYRTFSEWRILQKQET